MSSEEKHAGGNKCVVTVSPSSSPSRRCLVFIVAAVAVVALVVLLSTLIPIYATGKGKPDTSDEQLSEQQSGDDFPATENSSSTSIVIGLTTKSRGHSSDSVKTSSLGPLETKPLAKYTIPQGQTWSLPEVKRSVEATSAETIQKGQTWSLPKMTSLTTATSIISAAPIVSSMSHTLAESSIVDVAVIANLVANTESKWTRWSSWSDCTETCGTGTRQRKRTCVATNPRAVFAPISCAGKDRQVKSCAEWSCPDCSKNCTIGTLNAACDACTCDHHVLTGRILTVDDIPLSEANISLAETPYNILAQTNISGFFSTLGVCANSQQELLISKDGFVPVQLKSNVSSATTATITARLEIAVAPFVTVHPESKMRMPGQSVTFCCEGEGNPSPEIEWFKENNIIDKDLYNYNNVLKIPDVTGLNGSFRCRVINQFGSEFSAAAQLTVLDMCEDNVFMPQ